MGVAGTKEVGKALERLEGCPEETEDHSTEGLLMAL